MLSVLISSGVLAIPDSTASELAVKGWVETVLVWQDQASLLGVSVSKEALEILYDVGLYPGYSRIQSLLASHMIVEFDAPTVGAMLSGFFERTPYFEERERLVGVICDDLNVSPSVISQSVEMPNALIDDLNRSLFACSFLRTMCVPPRLDVACAISAWDWADPLAQISAGNYLVEHSRDDIPEASKSGASYLGSVLVCQSPSQLLSQLDESVIWLKGTDEAIHFAIEIAIAKLKHTHQNNPAIEKRQFSIGRQFVESVLERLRGDGPAILPPLLLAIAETICRCQLADTHKLRKGKGAKEPQVVRGKDKAWRRDVTYEYRLHYWECNDGSVELASIGPHNDYRIPA